MYKDEYDPCQHCPYQDACDVWEASVCPMIDPDADPWDI